MIAVVPRLSRVDEAFHHNCVWIELVTPFTYAISVGEGYVAIGSETRFLEASVAMSSDAVRAVLLKVQEVSVSVAVSKVSAESPSRVPSPVHTPTWLFTGVHTL